MSLDPPLTARALRRIARERGIDVGSVGTNGDDAMLTFKQARKAARHEFTRGEGRRVPRAGATSPAEATKRPKALTPRPWHPYRSKWEWEYAKYLDVLKSAKAIDAWAYEPESLVIGVNARYTPDFGVIGSDGLLEYREVKGYRREAAMVRLKAAAFSYPQIRFVLVTQRNGQWIHTPLTPRPR